MTDQTCERLAADGAELALGILDGESRAVALQHVDSCPACQQELAELMATADALQALTPAVEPPAGFESRVLAALARPRHCRRRLTVLVAAAVVAAVGVGGWAFRGALSGGGGYAPTTAALVERGGHPVGEVMLSGGAHEWMSMAVSGDLGNGTVTCELRETGGRLVVVGTFTLKNGAGYWAASVPGSYPEVLGADLRDQQGRVVAWTAWPPKK